MRHQDHDREPEVTFELSSEQPDQPVVEGDEQKERGERQRRGKRALLRAVDLVGGQNAHGVFEAKEQRTVGQKAVTWCGTRDRPLDGQAHLDVDATIRECIGGDCKGARDLACTPGADLRAVDEDLEVTARPDRR